MRTVTSGKAPCRGISGALLELACVRARWAATLRPSKQAQALECRRASADSVNWSTLHELAKIARQTARPPQRFGGRTTAGHILLCCHGLPSKLLSNVFFLVCAKCQAGQDDRTGVGRLSGNNACALWSARLAAKPHWYVPSFCSVFHTRASCLPGLRSPVSPSVRVRR